MEAPRPATAARTRARERSPTTSCSTWRAAGRSPRRTTSRSGRTGSRHRAPGNPRSRGSPSRTGRSSRRSSATAQSWRRPSRGGQMASFARSGYDRGASNKPPTGEAAMKTIKTVLLAAAAVLFLCSFGGCGSVTADAVSTSGEGGAGGPSGPDGAVSGTGGGGEPGTGRERGARVRGRVRRPLRDGRDRRWLAVGVCPLPAERSPVRMPRRDRSRGIGRELPRADLASRPLRHLRPGRRGLIDARSGREGRWPS